MILTHLILFFLSRKPRAEAIVSHTGKYVCTTNNVSVILPTLCADKKWGVGTETIPLWSETISEKSYSCILGVSA